MVYEVMDEVSSGAAAIVVVEGPHITAEENVKLRELLCKNLRAGNCYLILDLGAVETIDSMFIGSIVYTLRRIDGTPRGWLKLVNCSEQVKKSIDLMKLYVVCSRFETLRRGEASYANPFA